MEEYLKLKINKIKTLINEKIYGECYDIGEIFDETRFIFRIRNIYCYITIHNKQLIKLSEEQIIDFLLTHIKETILEHYIKD